MRKSRTIDSLFPPVRREILGTTLLAADRRWYLSELAAQFSATPSSLQRELHSLVEAGILIRTKDGQRTYYQADQSSPLFPELHGLFKKSVGAVDVLRDALAPFKPRIDLAFIFGSYVHQDQVRNTSDIDLMIVGDATPFELSEALGEVERRIGREVNPTVYTRKEFEERRRSGNHFLMSVLATETLPIIGDLNDLAAA